MKRIFLALALLLAPASAWAQCNGVFADGYVCGNKTGSPTTARPVPFTSFVPPGQALTRTDDTNVTITLTGTPATALLQAVNMTVGWTGQLAYTRGGTEASTQVGARNNIFPTPTRAGDIAYWNGTAWVTLPGNNSGTNVLQQNSSGVPSWAAPGTGTVTSAVIAAGTGISVSGTCTITTTGTCTVARLFTNAAIAQSPSAPANTSSTTAVMSGLGSTCAITPTFSGRLDVSFQFDSSNNTTSNLGTFDIRYGTGTAPSANVAVTGTQAAPQISVGYAASGLVVAATIRALITGLTPSTAYWLDLSRFTNANTLTISNIHCIAIEF